MLKETQDNDFKINDLINEAKEKFPKIYDVWKDKKQLSMLDLGCRFPMTMFICYHIFDFTNFVGVDIEHNEIDILNSHLSALQLPKTDEEIKIKEEMSKCNNFFELYSCLLQTDEKDLKPKILDLDEFNGVFLENFYFGTFIQTYLEIEKKKFDFINISNVLHFFEDNEDVEYIINRITKLLKKNGILHICVNDKHLQFDSNFMKEFLYKNFENGYIIQCKHKTCIETHFINVDYK